LPSRNLDYYPKANLVVKVNSRDEQLALSGLAIHSFVHATAIEAALLLCEKRALCNSLDKREPTRTE